LAQFLEALADELGERPILLPTRDHDVNFISRFHTRLSARFILSTIAPGVLESVMNKDALAATAREAGIDVPRGVTVREVEQIKLVQTLRFPCICKPVYSSQWRRPGVWEAVGRQKAKCVFSFEELVAFYAGFSALDPVIQVQEWIPGGERQLQIFGSYCASDHEVAAYFTARKRLQFPALAGTGIVVEAIRLPELVEPSRRLLRALNFHGISEIEFKRDERDGRLYLIEINPRHWDQHGLGNAVGVNLSEALYRDVTHQPQREMLQTNEPVIWVAEAEYLRHLLRCALGRADWENAAAAWGARRTWAVLDSTDPKPFLALMGTG
jgi:predicted ATP-grasp superfamily ATP-dependent carboligase